ncbi:hypothetical protein [Evansella tamaricis]|uniref:Uncharacterized protein n=1 Tax=Evansella tamaricis TaxID=2069301 RepID=A0ABS6JKC7_9BACI|nr:hypothetical protein [Evansella tamaricis]MBU9714130.1 hypothetical protein [Evansella tamaricis]
MGYPIRYLSDILINKHEIEKLNASFYCVLLDKIFVGKHVFADNQLTNQTAILWREKRFFHNKRKLETRLQNITLYQ